MPEAPFLKAFFISSDWDLDLGAKTTLEYGAASKATTRVLQSFEPLTTLISARLRKAKRVTTPNVTRAHVRIVKVASETPYLQAHPEKTKLPILTVDFRMDPEDLRDAPAGRAERGEKAIELTEAFLEDVKWASHFIQDFPFEVFEAALDEFRARDHAILWTTKPKPLEGTGLKVSFMARAAADTTTVTLTVLKRGQPVFSQMVRQYAGGNNVVASENYVEIKSDHLSIFNLNPLDPPVSIRSDALPEEIQHLIWPHV